MNVERDVTIAVKTFQRPEALLRLVESIRRFYPEIAVHVVDDSEQPLDAVPEGITRYRHLPFNSLGVSAGRNFGLRHVETEYVLVCDDDMVFGRRTDLGAMLRALTSTRFDLVSCMWMDHEPWRSIRRGLRRVRGHARDRGRHTRPPARSDAGNGRRPARLRHRPPVLRRSRRHARLRAVGRAH